MAAAAFFSSQSRFYSRMVLLLWVENEWLPAYRLTDGETPL
jgi:hypothetical protein